MKSVLVTGATGFIGRQCLEALQRRGFEVHAMSLRTEPQKTSNIFWHRIDLHNHLAVKGLLAAIRPSFLLHSAWYVEHGDHWSSEENLRWVTSSFNLAEAFINHGGERLVCIGTCAEYDWSELACSKSVSEELTALQPHTVYGASKAGLYMIIKALAVARGISFAWVAPFGPYGFYDNPKRLIPCTILSLLRREMMICNNPDFVRNFTFMEDIAEILAELMDHKVSGAINIANGQAVKLKYVIELVAKLLDAENLVQYKLNSLTTNDPPLLIADVTKLKNELGHIAPTSIEEGLQKSIAWWQEKSTLPKKSIMKI